MGVQCFTYILEEVMYQKRFFFFYKMGIGSNFFSKTYFLRITETFSLFEHQSFFFGSNSMHWTQTFLFSPQRMSVVPSLKKFCHQFQNQIRIRTSPLFCSVNGRRRTVQREICVVLCQQKLLKFSKDLFQFCKKSDF